MADELPKVVIVGRPNVGKSTLLNRLLQSERALVSKEPGTTRDPVSGWVQWRGRYFELVDTGGLGEGDPLLPDIRERAARVIETAALVLFLVDGSAGVLPEDREIADWLRRRGRPVLVVANKADRRDSFASEFYSLGFPEVIAISAAHGRGTGELLDLIHERLPLLRVPAEEDAPYRVVFLGRPNVGKSSLVNRLLGSDLLITGEIPGTTRDALAVRLPSAAGAPILVDTAGLRRPARLGEGLERLAGRRSREAAKEADVVVLVLEATEPLAEQDKRILAYIERLGRGLILFVNKIDLRPRSGQVREEVRRRLAHPDRYPVLLGSAVTGEGVDELLRSISAVAAAYRLRLPTGRLNASLREAVFLNPPPSVGGAKVKIRYAVQIREGPPLVALFVNRRHLLPDSYLRYLENRFREDFNLLGVPLRFVIRSGDHKPG